MASSYLLNVTDYEQLDEQDVICRLVALPETTNQAALEYAVKVMEIFHCSEQVQLAAIEAFVRMASIGQPSSASSVSRLDLTTSGAAHLSLIGWQTFEDNVEIAMACMMLLSCLALDEQCKDYLLNSSCVDVAIRAIHRFQSVQEVVIHALGCFRYLADGTERIMRLQMKGAVAAAVEVMRCYTTDLHVVSMALHCIWNFAANEATAIFLAEQGTLTLVTAAMKKFPRARSVLAPANGTLLTCARLDQLRAKVAEARGLKYMLDSIANFQQDEAVLPNALGALTMLAKSSDYRSKILSVGLGTILQAMHKQMDNAEMQLLFTGLFMVLTSKASPEFSNLLSISPRIGLSGFDLVCALMRQHLHQRDLIHHCLKVLLNVSLDPQFLPAIEKRALGSILFATRHYQEDVPIVTTCNHLLAELSQDEATLKGLLHEGAMVDLITSMKQFSSSSSHLMAGACRLITIMSANTENRMQLIKNGVPELVVEAMKRFPDDAEFLSEAASALWCLAHEKVGKERIYVAGGMAILKASMDLWPQEAQLWSNASGVLRSLITVDDYAAAFVEEFKDDLQDEGAPGCPVGLRHSKETAVA